jgi:hypothetical protein
MTRFSFNKDDMNSIEKKIDGESACILQINYTICTVRVALNIRNRRRRCLSAEIHIAHETHMLQRAWTDMKIQFGIWIKETGILINNIYEGWMRWKSL